MKLIDKVALIYLKDRKVLMTLSKGKDTYYLPGGKREGTETDAETLIRELREELSIRILPETLAPYGVFEAQAHGKAEGVLVRMSCYTSEFEGELKPANEIAELDWFTYKDKERTSAVDQIIFDDLKQKGLLS
ncbi:MAG: NUDIX domain-containing protein [Erysipelotrichaceae bacterium]|nr:NUDIX domain-containing protein [Erysipelotrichaceae bacterium]MBR2551451.1 NUDIX domain-containing protein [Erysipelotrichaceae bacterium]